MIGKAGVAVLRDYLASLVMTILFPLQWMRMMRVAKQHRELDPNATRKVAGAILASVLLAGVGTYLVVDFHNDARAGIYDSLDTRLATAIGEDQYQTYLKSEEAAIGLVALAERKITEAQDAGDAEAEQTWRDNKAQYEADLQTARDNIASLSANHALYGTVSQAVQAQDDERAKAFIANRNSNIEFDTMDERAERAFTIKDGAVADMNSMMLWFVYPGLFGAFWAPMAFALGSVLKRTFVPSTSIGFKPYPGASMGLFLLLGGFGVPALFFAAWTMQDVHVRTATGQIAL